jgi:hypothetical protein
VEIDSISGEGRMERKKRELRQKIINVAMKLFEQQGFSNTTMEQIAEAAGKRSTTISRRKRLSLMNMLKTFLTAWRRKHWQNFKTCLIPGPAYLAP